MTFPISQVQGKSRPRLTKKARLVAEAKEEPEQGSFLIDEEAKKLFRIYVAARRWFSGKKIPPQILHSSWGLKPFEKLVDLIKQREQETKLSIDKLNYIKAHFAVFGENTYPTHLASSKSWEIYRKFKEAVSYQVSSSHPLQEQQDLLQYLAEVRQESVEEIMSKLRNSGLFTEEFVGVWDESRKASL